MSRYSRVSEHPDTKSVVDLKSAILTHTSTIFVKWRPFGRPSSCCTAGPIPSIVLHNSRDPVSFGEVKGVLHLSVQPKANSVRFSRRGKEHTKSKTSEGGMELQRRRSDLMVGGNPWNGTRETCSQPKMSTRKCTTPLKARIQGPASVPAVAVNRIPTIERVRVW